MSRISASSAVWGCMPYRGSRAPILNRSAFDWFSSMYSLVKPDESPGIDGENIDVGPRGRRNGIPHRAEHRRRVVRGKNIVGGIVDAFAEEHHRLPASAHVREELGVVFYLSEHAQRALAALHVIHVVASVRISLAAAERVRVARLTARRIDRLAVVLRSQPFGEGFLHVITIQLVERG